MKKKGYIYLICDPSNNLFKIGTTRNLCSKRMKQLQTGNPTELHIVSIFETEFPFRMESMLHNKFANKHVLNEWYELSADDVNNFKGTCHEQQDIIMSLINNPFFNKDLR